MSYKIKISVGIIALLLVVCYVGSIPALASEVTGQISSSGVSSPQTTGGSSGSQTSGTFGGGSAVSGQVTGASSNGSSGGSSLGGSVIGGQSNGSNGSFASNPSGPSDIFAVGPSDGSALSSGSTNDGLASDNVAGINQTATLANAQGSSNPNTSQLAAAVTAIGGLGMWPLWILLIAIVLGLGYYFYKRRLGQRNRR